MTKAELEALKAKADTLRKVCHELDDEYRTARLDYIVDRIAVGATRYGRAIETTRKAIAELAAARREEEEKALAARKPVAYGASQCIREMECSIHNLISEIGGTLDV